MRELRERAEPILRIVCLILAAFVVYELAGVVLRWNPFRGVTVPELPALTMATNHPPAGAHGTNLLAAVKGTNGPPHSSSTNLAQPVAIAKTNPVAAPISATPGTNLIAHTEPATMGTNTTTNAATTVAIKTTTNATTNVVMQLEAVPTGTNAATAVTSTNRGTNVALLAAVPGTNAAPNLKKRNAGAGPTPAMAGMNFNPLQPPGKHGADLPPAVQSRISRITESEILGPVMHPLPMALLGIAGEFAFLRSANGQTGLVKEGDSLDDLKLLRIGINRVLIEQDGQKKELTIFSGYGSESLLQKDSSP